MLMAYSLVLTSNFYEQFTKKYAKRKAKMNGSSKNFKLPREMGKCFVGFGHAMCVFAFFDCRTFVA